MLTKKDVLTLRDQLQTLLDKNQNAFKGVSVRVGNGSYTENVFTLKIEFASLGENGVPVRKEYDSLVRNLPYLGLTPNDLDKTFKLLGRPGTYKLTGYKPRSQKYPFLVTCVETGKNYVCPRAVLNWMDGG